MKRALTLVEILIVLIILGILAAIVIPQFTDAAKQARISALIVNLNDVREALNKYKSQHGGVYPSRLELLTVCTYTTGEQPSDKKEHVPEWAHYLLGPYLDRIPLNPISNSNAVRTVTSDTKFSPPEDTDGGWWYNGTTGEFRADLNRTWWRHNTCDKLNDL